MPAPTDTAGVVACPSCATKNRVPSDASGRPRCARCSSDLPWLVEAGDADFDRVVLASPLPVLVDAWAAWCGPCHTIAPLVAHLAEAYAGRLKVVKVDVDRNPATAGRLGIQGIPALFFYDRGRLVDQQVGALPLPALQAKVDQVLGSSS